VREAGRAVSSPASIAAAVTGALGWRRGDRLTITASEGFVVARRDPHGMVALPARAYLAIPSVLRRRCGLRPGDMVLLAAFPGHDAVAAYPVPAVDRALRAHAPSRLRRSPVMSVMSDETVTGSGAPQQAAVAAALLVLETMGLSPADLTAVPRERRELPTFAAYVPVVSAVVSAGTRRAYGSYWKRVTEQWGDRHLDEPTPTEIRQLMKLVMASVVPRRKAGNPARKVAKPRRLPSTRRAVPDARLAEINRGAAAGGDDPELDTLILRLHTETACRRGGAPALRPQDLDAEQCLVLLREKGETVRWQPASPTLMGCLARHATERHAPPGGQLLRYRDGRPITYRRYDGLWERLGRALPWVRTQQVSTHWIQHTTLTWVERNFGYAVARAYAVHADSGDAGATSTYVRATESEVAAALAALTGEPHPLAGGEGW
jgi:integrase/recombinase XerC